MIRIDLEGDEALIARFAALNGRARELAIASLEDATDHVKNRAIEGIANGPKTGRIYTERFATNSQGNVFAYGSRPPHQASAPGEYPAADTGNLMRTIWADVDRGIMEGIGDDPLDVQTSFTLNQQIDDAGRVVGSIGADAQYAAPLEYKPPERGGRPFLRRALNESDDDIRRIFRATMTGQFRR